MDGFRPPELGGMWQNRTLGKSGRSQHGISGSGSPPPSCCPSAALLKAESGDADQPKLAPLIRTSVRTATVRGLDWDVRRANDRPEALRTGDWRLAGA